MNINKNNNAKLINCILPKGHALPLMEKLAAKGVLRIGFSFARGFDIHDQPLKSGMPEQVEKEMVYVVAENEVEATNLFELIYNEAGINKLGGGFMYQSSLGHSSVYLLPELS